MVYYWLPGRLYRDVWGFRRTMTIYLGGFRRYVERAPLPIAAAGVTKLMCVFVLFFFFTLCDEGVRHFMDEWGVIVGRD